MSDLHDRILAAVEAREKIANAATGPRWTSNGSWEIRTPPSGSRDRNPDGPDWYQIVRAPESDPREDIHEFKLRLWANTTHIAANDPFTVLRHCARDRKVLERHARDERMSRFCFWCSEDGYDPINVEYPCVEVRELAELYEVALVA